MTIENCQSKNGDDLKNAKQMTLNVIEPTDPNYHKPLDVLIEDLAHAEPGLRYGNVVIMVEDLTDVLFYLAEFQQRLKRYKFRRLSK